MDLDIFSIFLILGGAYLLYTAVLLIKDRKVTPSVMLSPGTAPEAIKDLDGFIRFMFPRILAVGLVTLVTGLIDILFPAVSVLFWYEIGTIIGYTVLIIFYIRWIREAEEKFAGIHRDKKKKK